MYPAIEKILFLDIETVPGASNYGELPDHLKSLWDVKSAYVKSDSGGTEPAETYERAGIYAEFGKIICISFGIIHYRAEQYHLRIKSIFGDNEQLLLEEFAKLLNEHYANAESRLCAHNGKEFDFPYLARRMVINGVTIPDILNTSGKKPWEVNHLDTLEMWKFGDYKHFTSLELLTTIFGFPTPKDDIKGKDVARVYYEENDLSRIVEYCQKDVMALVQVFLKIKNLPPIEEKNIEHV